MTQRLHLVAPDIPEARETVDEKDRWPLTCFDIVNTIIAFTDDPLAIGRPGTGKCVCIFDGRIAGYLVGRVSRKLGDHRLRRSAGGDRSQTASQYEAKSSH
ncbi:MAG: hypothetical protein V2I43_29070 [Parvularcula sp.]|nr:hypothetical protein [Parvularcula sp.]